MPKSKDINISTSVEDYLKAIWLTAQDDLAGTNALASHLAVSAPSVSAMLAKLQELGYAEYERYRGVRLTPLGRQEALRLLRRHRLIETFLLERLDFGWDEVHDEAERLEHAVSDRFTERLADLLGHPTHDPHGDPIPDTDGSLPDTPNLPLSDVEDRQAFTVHRLRTQTSEVLAYLANLGIQPGAKLEVRKREPIGGLIHVDIEGRRVVLSKELAVLIRGEESA